MSSLKRSLKIRDHMDEVLEARGFYRKHIASDSDSLFRSVSDVIFDTQAQTHLVKHAFQVRMNFLGKDSMMKPEKIVQEVVELFQVEISVMENVGDDFRITIYQPEKAGSKPEPQIKTLLACDECMSMFNEEKKDIVVQECMSLGSSKKMKRIFLSFIPGGIEGGHFDPIYSLKTIVNSGMIQSIVFEVLYSEVFHLRDCMEAAQKMLYGEFPDAFGKPDVYDKEFYGTALEALENFLIPFPYKVAKTLSPDMYRNIEYDVWTNDQKNKQLINCDSNYPTDLKSISKLECGSPVAIRHFFHEELLGFVIKPSKDRRCMEVFIPDYNCNFQIPRAHVCPVRSDPDLLKLFSSPSQGSLNSTQSVPDETVDSNEVKLIQDRNQMLVSLQTPNWVDQCNFTVPPPFFYPVGPPNYQTTGTEVIETTWNEDTSPQFYQPHEVSPSPYAFSPSFSYDPSSNLDSVQYACYGEGDTNEFSEGNGPEFDRETPLPLSSQDDPAIILACHCQPTEENFMNSSFQQITSPQTFLTNVSPISPIPVLFHSPQAPVIASPGFLGYFIPTYPCGPFTPLTTPYPQYFVSQQASQSSNEGHIFKFPSPPSTPQALYSSENLNQAKETEKH